MTYAIHIFAIHGRKDFHFEDVKAHRTESMKANDFLYIDRIAGELAVINLRNIEGFAVVR